FHGATSRPRRRVAYTNSGGMPSARANTFVRGPWLGGPHTRNSDRRASAAGYTSVPAIVMSITSRTARRDGTRDRPTPPIPRLPATGGDRRAPVGPGPGCHRRSDGSLPGNAVV